MSPELARESGRLEWLIRQAIEQSRDLAKGFYPVELERLGLVAALQEIPRHMKQLSTIGYVVESDENVIVCHPERLPGRPAFPYRAGSHTQRD